MAIKVRGLDGLEFSGDEIQNSVLLHELCHHLQFASTTAGLDYHMSAFGSHVAVLNLARGVFEAFPSDLVPRELAAIVGRARDIPRLSTNLSVPTKEMGLRNSYLGWPAPAHRRAVFEFGLEDGSGRVEAVPAGLLLIAEGHARALQMEALEAREGGLTPEIMDQVGIGRGPQGLAGALTHYRMYLALRYGFVDTLGAPDFLGNELFRWACVKSLMPPPMPTGVEFANSSDARAAVISWYEEHNHEPCFPGARFGALAKVLLNNAGGDDWLGYCVDQNWEGLDIRVCSVLGWTTAQGTIDELEVRADSLEPGLRKRLEGAAVQCHRRAPWFLVNPIPHLGELLALFPPLNWIHDDGTMWLSDWCTHDERLELFELAITSLVATSIERGAPIQCPHSNCCHAGPDTASDLIGLSTESDACHLERSLGRRYGLSLAMFEKTAGLGG